MALNGCVRKEERFKINHEKEEQAKLNPSRINEIIKIGMEIITMKTKKQEKNPGKQVISLKISTNLTNLKIELPWRNKRKHKLPKSRKNITTNPTEIKKD